MKRLLTTALVAVSMTLASCATTPTAAQVAPQIERAQVAYNRIAVAAEVILPFLPPARAAQVRLAMSLAERGFMTARYARTVRERLDALRQAEAASGAIESNTESDRRHNKGGRSPLWNAERSFNKPTRVLGTGRWAS